jgi:hypothetical protein
MQQLRMNASDEIRVSLSFNLMFSSFTAALSKPLVWR